MKDKFLLILLISLLVIQTIKAESCSNSVLMSIYLQTLENGKPTSQEFPIFREGDILAIKKINITNTGTCSFSNYSFFKITLMNSNADIIDSPFCIQTFIVDSPLKPNESYWEIWQPTSTGNYITSTNESTAYCYVLLNNTGRWTIKMEPIEGSIYPKITGYSFEGNGRVLSEVGFRVYSQLEIGMAEATEKGVELAKKTKNLTWATIFISIIAVGAAIYSIWHSKKLLQKEFDFQRNRNKERQKNLLLSLKTEINVIKEDSKGYQDTFERNIPEIDKKRKSYRNIELPLYPIKVIDAYFYSKHLEENQGNKDLMNELKKKIFLIYDKAILMNTFLSWLHKSEFEPKYRTVIKINSGGETYKKIMLHQFYPRLEDTKVDLDKALKEIEEILTKLVK